jgi:hydroxyacylglutathione hydrolase
VPSSTVGYEKLVNWAFAAATEEQFVAAVLEGQPEPPAYFANSKIVNRAGPANIGDLSGPPPLLTASSVSALQRERQMLLVDVRPADAFAAGHAPGAISIPLTRSFTTYAGSVVNTARPVVLVTADDGIMQAKDARRELALIGIDHVLGYVPAPDLAGTETLDRIQPAAAMARRDAGETIIDVRNGSELVLGRVPGTRHIPFPQLVERMGEIDRTKPFLVMCQTGARSTIAASVLRAAGYPATDAGGIVQWERAGGEVE